MLPGIRMETSQASNFPKSQREGSTGPRRHVWGTKLVHLGQEICARPPSIKFAAKCTKEFQSPTSTETSHQGPICVQTAMRFPNRFPSGNSATKNGSSACLSISSITVTTLIVPATCCKQLPPSRSDDVQTPPAAPKISVMQSLSAVRPQSSAKAHPGQIPPQRRPG